MLYDILIGFFVAGILLVFVWLMRGMLLMPLKKGKHTDITVVVKVRGFEPGLEQTVTGLSWLESNGTIPANVVIVDDGMDEETLNVARHLVRRHRNVCLRRKDVSLWGMNEEQLNYRDASTQ